MELTWLNLPKVMAVPIVFNALKVIPRPPGRGMTQVQKEANRSNIMKWVGLAIGLFIFFSATPGLGADIDGRIWLAGSGATPINATVTASSKEVSQSGAVNKLGLYRISGLPMKSSCTVIVNYNNMTSIPITVYTNSIRNTANLEIKIYHNQLLIIRK